MFAEAAFESVVDLSDSKIYGNSVVREFWCRVLRLYSLFSC